MEESTPECSLRAFTNAKIIEYDFMWTINNFTYCTKTHKKLVSPNFVDVKKGNFKWCIHFYLGDKDTLNYSRVFLNLVNYSENTASTRLKFSLLDVNKRICHTSGWSIVRLFSEDQFEWGYPCFIPTEILINKANNYIVNDSLTILCEIKVFDDTESSIETDALPLSTVNSQKHIINDLNSLWQTGAYSDLTLNISGQRFNAHKVILSMRSSTFATAIQKLAGNEMVIDTFAYKVMIEVLRFMYCGHVENLESNAIELLSAATTYNLPELKNICEESIIKTGLNVNNVISLVSTAVLLKAEKLKNEAIKFITSHSRELLDMPGTKEFETISPQLFKEIFTLFQVNSENKN